MSDDQNPPPLLQPEVTETEPPQESKPAPPSFDPSRMIGIIKRKALIKDLAARYHSECLAYGQELLELQKHSEEPFMYDEIPDNPRKETAKATKRSKKTR